MRKSLLATLLTFATIIPLLVYGGSTKSFAQVGSFLTGDEFNNDVFAAPFVVKCGANAFPATCPDAQSAGGTQTWSLNKESPGNLRIYTQPGTLVGAANNARNFVVQPYSNGLSYVVTTKLTFPAVPTNFTPLGQSAGLIAYLNDDNFIDVARVYSAANGVPQLEFRYEANGSTQTSQIVTVPETSVHSIVYLQLTKSANTYTAAYSFDNVTFTPFFAPAPSTTATPVNTVGTGTATPTTVPTAAPTAQGYTADFSSAQPYVGVFAWGGPNATVAGNIIPADFDWFRVGNPGTPAPTALPTSTGIPAATATSTTGPTSTAVPATSTPIAPTATSVPPTATAIPATATSTVIPTPTPQPRAPAPRIGFKYISLWYHQVRRGTFDHLEVQARNRVAHGIWVHVYFPTGVHFNYYENTDGLGHWTKEFNIPRNSLSQYSNQAVITIQLWRAKSTAKDFITFNIVK
ncbi:MAG: hypothetical protein NVS2B16_00340 [Chloroflexota bacterium]